MLDPRLPDLPECPHCCRSLLSTIHGPVCPAGCDVAAEDTDALLAELDAEIDAHCDDVRAAMLAADAAQAVA